MALTLACLAWCAASSLLAQSGSPPPATQPSVGAATVTRFPDDAVVFKFYIRNRERRVAIVPRGESRVVLIERGNRIEELTPDEFTQAIVDQQSELNRRPWIMRALNITSWVGVAWVSLGLFGQAMFTFRMVLQWLASEKQGKSVVPVAFWWGSLIGGLMLLAYFIWRQDIVGIIGQSTGAFIYARNLVLIYRDQAKQISAAVDPGPEPELK